MKDLESINSVETVRQSKNQEALDDAAYQTMAVKKEDLKLQGEYMTQLRVHMEKANAEGYATNMPK